MSENRRQVLRSAARVAVAAALGGLVTVLGLRRADKGAGYCNRAGRCGGCPTTADCGVYQALHAEPRR